jgi:hypothetical protein
MSRKALFVCALVALLLVSGPVLAQGPVVPQHSDVAWQASYWNNMTLNGSPILQRADANIDFNWGQGSPDPSVHSDGFSARWTRYLDLAAGTYRFTATSDDGIRVSVDGDWIINEWNDHSAKSVSADRSLSGGHHLVVVEYYENKVDAVAKLTWTAAATITHWRGEYFNNKILAAPAALVRDDVQIDFHWGTGSPAPGVVNSDGFSVRWTQSPNLEAGNYRFTMTVDDGGRLWVNNHLLIDAWKDQAPRTYSQVIYLAGGSVPIRMEYYENTGGATAQLSWAKEGATSDAIIVDDTDAGFIQGGAPASWRTVAEGYGGRLTWTKNNDQPRANYNWAHWVPNLSARQYEVFVYIPDRYTTTAQAQYWVSHAGGFTLRVVDQSKFGGQWVSLGTYRFRGTSEDYVSLSDVTYEPYLSRLIAFDAVKWVPR